MSPALALLGAMLTSTRAAGIGASPASSLPSLSSVPLGRSGSNGPIDVDDDDRSPNTRENGPTSLVLPLQLSTPSMPGGASGPGASRLFVCVVHAVPVT